MAKISFNPLKWLKTKKLSSDLTPERQGLPQQFLQSLFQLINVGNQELFPRQNKRAAVNAYTSMSDVYAVVNLITNQAATIPFELFIVKDKKALDDYKYQLKEEGWNLKAAVLQQKALEKVEDKNNDILKMWRCPNRIMSGKEFRRNYYGMKLITGDGLINGIKPIAGANKDVFRELWVLPSQDTTIISGGFREPISSYVVDLFKQLRIPAEDVMHSRMFNPDYKQGQMLYGLSPLNVAFMTIATSKEADISRVSQFKNNGAFGIISGNAPNEDMVMSEDEMKDISDKYKERFGGSENIGKVLFTMAGVDYTNMGISPVDLGINESKLMDLRTIARVYNVPSNLLNDPAGSTFNNQREGKKALITDAVMPHVNDFADDWNEWFISGYSKRDNVEYAHLPDWKSVPVLQDELSSKIESVNKIWQLTPNQQLDLLDLPQSTDPNMDKIYIPNNVTLLDEVAKPKNTMK